MCAVPGLAFEGRDNVLTECLIDIIAGARPNFMKIAPIIDALKVAEARSSGLRYRLIHTGQHYDKAMSGILNSITW